MSFNTYLMKEMQWISKESYFLEYRPSLNVTNNYSQCFLWFNTIGKFDLFFRSAWLYKEFDIVAENNIVFHTVAKKRVV